jgi:hypothetical protein
VNVRSVWIIHRICTNPVGYCNVRGERLFVDLAPMAFLSVVSMIQDMGGQLSEDFYPVGIYGITEKETIGVLTAHDDKNMLFLLVGGKGGRDLRGLPSFSSKNLRSALQQILRTLDFLIPEDCKGMHYENQDLSYAIDYSVGALQDLDESGFPRLYPVRTISFDLEDGLPVSISEQHDKRIIDVNQLDPTTRTAIQTKLGFMVARVTDIIPFFKGISDQMMEYLGVPPKALIMTFGLSDMDRKYVEHEGESIDEYSRLAILASLSEEEEDVVLTFLVPAKKKAKGAERVSKILSPLLEKEKSPVEDFLLSGFDS